jgi:Asp-tRNA(Asn)/Glu-tRNA(Gln) amidotransferase C subunit
VAGGADLAKSSSEEEVAVLARAAGLTIPPQRLAVVAERLRDMYELAAVIEEHDLDGIEIGSRFDPSWPAAGGASR